MASNSDEQKATGNPQRMSSQMQAVVRLLSGQEERTIAQKLADSNRPTWEQYKKDNEDKLNLEGMDQKKMEEYRTQLDSEREKLLSRGKNHSKDKKKKKKRRRRDDSDDDSSDSDSHHHRHKKHHKKKKKRKRKHKHRRDDDSSDSSSSYSSEDDRRRRHKRKRKSKRSKKDKNDDGGESDGSHYRLSKFFDQGKSDSE